MEKGIDVRICSDVYFKNEENIKLGSHISIDKGFYCTTSLEMGDYIHISPYVTCIGGDNGMLIAHGFNNIMAGARIICSSDRFSGLGLPGAMIPERFKGESITKPVVLHRFSNLGTNAIALPGSTLREGVLVTAGSLIMGDTVPWGIYKGNPARLTKIIDSSGILKQYELFTKSRGG
jgi:acetyltransferase-like isoleucine patch superfamily enzyme